MNKTIYLSYDGYYREPNFSSIPSISGVYSFFECRYNMIGGTVTLLRLLYIGQATNCRDRIMNHDKLDEMKRKISFGNQLCVHVAAVKEQDKDRVENALIYEHQPPYNDLLKNSFNHDTTTIVNSGCYSNLKANFTVYRTQQFRFGSIF